MAVAQVSPAAVAVPARASVRERPGGVLLRMINVLLLLSCSSCTGGYSTASIAAAQAGEERQNDSLSASALRNGAETALSKGEHDKAIRLFTKVIELEPKNERNFYKRFRVYLSKRKYAEAISDLSRALELKPTYKQALAQRAKLLKIMGQCEGAVRDYASLATVAPGHEDLSGPLPGDAAACHSWLSEVPGAESAGDWRAAVALYDKVLDLVGGEGAWLLLARARAHWSLGRWHEVVADAGRAAKLGQENEGEALELRGLAYIQLGEFETAAGHFRQVLMDDPDNARCLEGHRRCRGVVKKLQAGEAALGAGDVAAATGWWREATTAEPDNPLFVGPLLRRISSVNAKAKDWKEAKRAAEEAVNVQPKGLEGMEGGVLLGDALFGLEEFEEAVRAYSVAQQEADPGDWSNAGGAEKLQKAKVAVAQSKKKNYYKILGVPRDAEMSQIKKAYRNLAKVYHPDKVQGDEEEQEKAEDKFREVAEAYEVLSDEELRAKHDRGEEVFENQGGGGGEPTRQHFHFGGGRGRRHHTRTHFRFG
ncbi:unnamed protein product [Discosporangium mesarthrocarpum]